MNPIGYHVTSRVFRRSFQCAGIWFPDKVSYLYSFYAVVLYVLCSLLYVLFTVVHLCSVKSVADATQALFMVTIVLSIASKTTNLMFFNKRVRKLFNRLHNDFHLHNEIERNFVNTKLRSFLNILIAYFVLCVVCVSTGCIASALKPNIQLPFPTWYPLNWTVDTFSFWFAWSHLSFATSLAIFTNGGVQLFTSYLMFFISVLMQVLGQRLCKLWHKLDENEKSKQSTTSEPTETKELIACVKMHQTIIEVIEEYKTCFSYTLLYDVCSTALGMCSTVYQLVMLSNKDFSSYTFLITFLLIQNGQIFLPCYYGNELILSSDDLSRQSYRSNWMEMTEAPRRTFIYLLERLKRESQIVVGKLFSLSLETYTTVERLQFISYLNDDEFFFQYHYILLRVIVLQFLICFIFVKPIIRLNPRVHFRSKAQSS